MSRRLSVRPTGGARLFVLVQDHEHSVMEEVSVEGRKIPRGRFGQIPFNAVLRRYVLEDLRPSAFEIRVRGPRGTSEERRKVRLRSGDNHVQVMLGKHGMLSFDADGMKYYFVPRRDVLLLSVRGAKEDEQVKEVMGRTRLKYEVLPDATGKITTDDMLLVVSIGGLEKAEKNRARLETVLEKDFPERGLSGRLAAPVYKGGEPSFGLTNEIVVRFESWVTDDQIKKLVARHDLTIERNISYLGNTFLLRRHAPVDYDILDVIEDLRKSVEVVYAQPNLLLRLQSFQHVPNDYLFPEVPHLELVQCDDAWQTLGNQPGGNVGGSPDIIVAVLDLDGVDPTHADLTGQLSDGSQKMVASFDFVNMNNQTFGNLPGEHGTQCAGSATARMDNNIGACGVAPNCHLIGGRFGAATLLDIADIWVWMAGFQYFPNPNLPAQLAKGADIISNSWGPMGAMAPDPVLRDVFDFLTTYGRGGRGCIVCFATGNYGYVLLDNRNPFAADEKTFAIGASINTNPTNPCTSTHADHNGNSNNLPAVVDTRSYFSPFGMTVDIVSPSHTCYDPALPPARIRDAVLAPARTNMGDWPGNAAAQTTLTQAEAQGATVIQVANSAGFNVGEFALFNGPSVTPNETKRITAVVPGQITVLALENAYPVGTPVITGPNDYAKNPVVGFGGTSHSCPTVAGAAALLLSVKPDLTWIEVRSILRENAVQIDPAQAFATGQWIDLDGDNVVDFSQWYGYGRLDVNAAVNATLALAQRADVVVRDNLNDTGAVPTPGWHAHSPDLWVRRTDDPIPTLAYNAGPPHENPVRGQDNYVFMRVKNVGTAASDEVYLRAYIKHFAGVDFTYPDEWQPTTRFGDPILSPLVPGTYLIGEERIDNLAAGGDIIVKMTWQADLIPPDTVLVGGVNTKWHPCLLAEVSPHDGPPPATTAATYEVMKDNNLAQRNISIDDPLAGASFAVCIVAGSSAPLGVDAAIIDRSLLPANYRVFVKAADNRHMSHWVKLLEEGKLVAAEPLPDSPYKKPKPSPAWPEKPSKNGRCRVTLLDSARLGIDCCDGNAIIINAPARTQIELLCRGGDVGLGRPRLTKGSYQGQEVIFFDGGSQALKLPLRLASREFVPLVVGLARPTGKRGGGILKVTQLRGDGELSAGYTIEG